MKFYKTSSAFKKHLFISAKISGPIKKKRAFVTVPRQYKPSQSDFLFWASFRESFLSSRMALADIDRVVASNQRNLRSFRIRLTIGGAFAWYAQITPHGQQGFSLMVVIAVQKGKDESNESGRQTDKLRGKKKIPAAQLRWACASGVHEYKALKDFAAS